MWPTPANYLNIDISRIDALARVAHQRDGGFHVLAGSVSNLSVAGSMLEKVRELLQTAGENFIVVNDSFDASTLSNLPSGTLFFFSEIRKQETQEHSALLVERCLSAGGTVFAVIHGKSLELVAERLLSLGMSQGVLDTQLKIESVVTDLP